MGMPEELPPPAPAETTVTNEEVEAAAQAIQQAQISSPIMDDGDLNITEDELSALDAQLDQLTMALDKMESKRDFLHQELTLLLEQSQEVRKELRASKEASGCTK